MCSRAGPVVIRCCGAYVDIMTQDIVHLRNGNSILKPVYQHFSSFMGNGDRGLSEFERDDLRGDPDTAEMTIPPTTSEPVSG